MQHVKTILLEQTVRKPAVKHVVGHTTPATMSMDPVFSDVLMDIKEKDARIVSKVKLLTRIDYNNIETSYNWAWASFLINYMHVKERVKIDTLW